MSAVTADTTLTTADSTGYTADQTTLNIPPASGIARGAVTFADSVSTIPVYDVGDRVRVIVTYTDLVGGALVDPGALAFTLRLPGGTLVTYTYDDDAELVRDSLGVYHVDISADIAGRYHFRYVATGEDQGVTPGQFTVQSNRVH